MYTLYIVLAVIFAIAATPFFFKEKHILLGFAFGSAAIGMVFLVKSTTLLEMKKSNVDANWVAGFFLLIAVALIVIEFLPKRKHAH